MSDIIQNMSDIIFSCSHENFTAGNCLNQSGHKKRNPPPAGCEKGLPFIFRLYAVVHALGHPFYEVGTEVCIAVEQRFHTHIICYSGLAVLRGDDIAQFCACRAVVSPAGGYVCRVETEAVGAFHVSVVAHTLVDFAVVRGVVRYRLPSLL